MSVKTVDWLAEREYTTQAADDAADEFERQLPEGEVAYWLYIERGEELLWGWWSKSCSMLFVEHLT